MQQLAFLLNAPGKLSQRVLAPCLQIAAHENLGLGLQKQNVHVVPGFDQRTVCGWELGQIRRLSRVDPHRQIVQHHPFGHRLFERRGRTLVPTAIGRVVYQYAEDIFGLGGEMLEALRGRPAGRALQLTVGVANAVPKLIVSRLLQPVLRERRDVKIVCVEGNPEELLTRLATHARAGVSGSWSTGLVGE